MMNRRLNSALLILLGVLACVPFAARAIDDIPSFKTTFYNTYYPKMGQGNTDIPAGQVRDAAATLYEGWWREESYYRQNPVDGSALRGFNMKTKVYGDKPVPWTHGIMVDPANPGNGMVSPKSWVGITGGAAAPVAGPSFGGERNLETARNGQRYGGTGPLVDGYWTPGERFWDTMLVAGQPPNGRFDTFLADEDFWRADNTNTLSLSSLARSLVHIPGGRVAGDWDWRRGEYYADYYNDTLVNSTTTIVVQVGFESAVQIWVADTTRGVNIPLVVSEQQLDLSSVPTVVVTTVTNPPVIVTTTNPTPVVTVTTNPAVITTTTNYQNVLITPLTAIPAGSQVIYTNLLYGYFGPPLNTLIATGSVPVDLGFIAPIDMTIGPIFGNLPTTVTVATNGPTVVTTTNFVDVVTVTTNAPVVFAVTNIIYSAVGGNQGDFFHTLVNNGLASTPPNANVPRNGLFDYNVDANGNPLVYPAVANGLVPTVTGRVYVVFQSYLWLAAATPYIDINNNYYVVPQVQGGGVTPTPRAPPYYMNDYGAANVSVPPYSGQIRLCTIYVPIYQAGELWGLSLGQFGNTRLYVDWGYPSFPGNPPPYPNDNRWTRGHDHEPFQDFQSWWMPHGGLNGNGAWVDAVVGYPASGVPHLGPTPLSQHMGDPASPNAITYSDYVQYVNHNYPGNIAGLVARCANGIYDGPDDWGETGPSATNKYQWSGESAVVATPPPGNYGMSGWDFYGQHGGSWDGWWADSFSQFGSAGAPAWIGSRPNVAPYAPVNPAVDYATTITGTNIVITGGVPTPSLVYASIVRPPIGKTWGYNGTREFEDLASSMYHRGGIDSGIALMMAGDLAGDMRLGEPTDPWTFNISGTDKGTDIPFMANVSPDNTLPSSGPMAYNVHGCDGFDAGNQLNIEILTWRFDPNAGDYWTGPRGDPAGRTAGVTPGPAYTHDHRDLNLDGLLDLGETIPDRSQNYSTDAVRGAGAVTPQGGRLTAYPFNWFRYFEDCVAAWDEVEDYNALLWNNTTGSGDLQIIAPNWFEWVNGMSMTGYLNDNKDVRFHQNGSIPHVGFDPETDDLWIDLNGDGVYTIEAELHLGPATNALAVGVDGGPGLSPTLYLDINGSGAFEPATDFAWYDASGNGAYDTDLVLVDAQKLMAPGQAGRAVNWIEPAVVVCYQDVNGDSAPDVGDNFWLENRGTNTITPNVFDLAGDDILFVGSPAVFADGVAGLSAVGAYYRSRQPFDAGWQPGDDVWILGPSGSPNVFTAEEPVCAPNGLALHYLGATTNVLTGVAYVDRNGSSSYQYAFDDTWLDSDGDGFYSVEPIAVNHNGLANGVPGTLILNVAWLDLEENGTFDPVRTVTLGEDQMQMGDVLWLDTVPTPNGNGLYDRGTRYRIGVYSMGWASPGADTNRNPGAFGGLSIGPHLADFGYSCLTRDDTWMGGLAHLWPQNLGFVGATHEQGHELVGWPDYYDYNSWGQLQGVIHRPVGSYDLMANGVLVHGIASTKRVWTEPQRLNGANGILGAPNTGVKTLLLYPVERMPDQYYWFLSPNGTEAFAFWYVSGQSPYSVYSGRQGIMIEHDDGGDLLGRGHPLQQRVNYRFSSHVVQADGLYEMEDGVNAGDPGDMWGVTNKVFNEYSMPPARWWSQEEAGIRIVDIRLPANPLDPAEVDFEYVGTVGPWYWVGPSVGAATSTVTGASTAVAGTGTGASGGSFNVLAGGSRGDSDGDGIPDAWEIYWFGRYNNPLAVCTATSDWDGDGLTDYAEWLAHLNPLDQWSWSLDLDTTKTDADADLDGDLISNTDEYARGTNMREPDSDDDGWSDSQEINPNVPKPDESGPYGVRRITSPLDSRSPLIQRSLHLGAADTLRIPSSEINDSQRFMVSNFTVEAWVRLDRGNETGTVLCRRTAQGETNFVLGVRSNVAYAGFTTEGGNPYIAAATTPLASNVWYHLAGVYNVTNHSLRLYVNGALAGVMTALELPAAGHPTLLAGGTSSGTVTLGGGIDGFVDEVRIWNSARTSSQIATGHRRIVNSPWLPGSVTYNGVTQPLRLLQSVGNDGSLIANFRFDDSQNTTITNLLDGQVHKGGAEDSVHPLGANEGCYWNGGSRGFVNGTPVDDFGYCLSVPVTPSAYFSTNCVRLGLMTDNDTPVDDINEDGIADSWQVLYWPQFSVFTNGPWAAIVDADGDGIDNLGEYRLDTSPTDPDTDHNGVIDGLEDDDDDGLSNIDESRLGTDPRDPDTDDDGVSDGEEVNSRIVKADGKLITSPTYSRSPFVSRSLVLDGTAHAVPSGMEVGDPDRFDLDTWTLEAWVNPATANETGSLIKRTVTLGGGLTFDLRLDANRPSARFTTGAGVTVSVGDPSLRKIPSNAWTHVATVWDPARSTLEFFTNGVLVAAQVNVTTPAQGVGTVTLGEGLHGLLDDVRIWSVALAPDHLLTWRNRHMLQTMVQTTVTTATTNNAGGAVDVVFVFDTSGTMSLWINQVSQNINTFVQQLAAQNVNAQVAILDYVDGMTGNFFWDGFTPYGFYSSPTQVANVLAGLSTDGATEAGSAALIHALQPGTFNPGYRPNAKKFFILITDEQIDQGWPPFMTVPSMTLNQVIQQLVSQQVTVNVVRDPFWDGDANMNGIADGNDIAQATGGTVFDITQSFVSILPGVVSNIVSQATTVSTQGVSVTKSTLAAYYTFDDSQNTTISNRLTGRIDSHGAEDTMHQLDWRYAVVPAAFSTNGAPVVGDEDVDASRLGDWWEKLFFLGPVSWTNDTDGDGLINLYEYRFGLNPHDVDTDGDGIWDALERFPVPIDPSVTDSDGDGMPDAWEIYYGLDPFNGNIYDGLLGPYADPDHDGLCNLFEYLAGSNPWNPDSNGSGYFDYDNRAGSNLLTYGELYDDRDGMPPLWEIQRGLSPNMYDAHADWDADGWSAYAEYMAGSNPLDGNSTPAPTLFVTVWYAGPPVTGDLRIEAYTTATMDGDPDAVLSANLAAGALLFVGTETVTVAAPAGSSALTLASVSGLTPGVTILTGVGMANGTYVAGVTGTVVTLNQPTTAQIPAGATLTASDPTAVHYPATLVIATGSNQVGRLREGDNWFFGYVDQNSNNQWDPGEPAGIAPYQPLNLTWGSLAFDLFLQDAPQGMPRIAWTLPGGATATRVQIDYTSGALQNVLDVIVRAPRNYLTEADLLRVGITNGLFVSNSGDLNTGSGYRWTVDFDPPDSTSTFVPDQAYQTFTQRWTSAISAQPVILAPLNEVIRSLPLQLEWKATERTSAFSIELRRNSTTGTVVFSSLLRAPYYRDNGGQTHYVFTPQYLQTHFLPLTDGTYWWKVKCSNNGNLPTGAWSDWSYFVLDMAGTNQPSGTTNGLSTTGPFSIDGSLRYFGKVANHAADEPVITNSTARSFTNRTLLFKPVDFGYTTVRVYRAGASNLVVFSDRAVATPTNLASVRLQVVTNESQAGWLNSTCTVNYTSGLLSLTLPANLLAGDKVLVTYDYNYYPFVVQAYATLDLPGFSGKPLAQTSIFRKGAFRLTGLSAGSYDLLGFIDGNFNGRVDPWETWGFVRNQVPASGPGYQEIHPLTVGPSITAASNVRLVMRDRDTDNDRLPDAWEIQKFGSLAAHVGGDVVFGTTTTIWQTYADGPLDSDPNLWDTDYDGLPDTIELLLLTDTHSPDTDRDGVSDLEEYLSGSSPTNPLDAEQFVIPTLSTEPATGNPVIAWSSPKVPAGVIIRYTILRSTSLAGGWSGIGAVVAYPGDDAQPRSYTDDEPGRPAGAFYRLVASVEAVN
jgi:hypothetical protein